MLKHARLSIALVFVLGCVVGGASSHFVVPPARAQVDTGRWEYFCFSGNVDPTDMMLRLNEAGAQGWELQSSTPIGSIGSSASHCMKRRAP